MSDSTTDARESGGVDAPDSRDTLDTRTNALEEAYEFFLAYAAQGLRTETGGGTQIRQFLTKFESAVDGLGAFFTSYITGLGVDVGPYRGFITVIDRDARDAQAAVQMVLAQPVIHSQMIDNLNANIHVRALLTDIFLVDEILKTRQRGE